MKKPMIFNAGDNTWKNRLCVVKQLGFNDYKSYLASDLWKQIRLEVMRRAKWRCRCCKERATDVHHKTYAKRVMQGIDLFSLYALCYACHKLITFDHMGRYLSEKQSADRLTSLLRRSNVERKRIENDAIDEEFRSILD